MMKIEKMLSKTQLTFTIIQSQIGVGLLSLPYVVHKHAKHDGWISGLVAGLGVFFLVFIMWLLGKRFPNDTIYDYSSKIVGKYIGNFISFLYVLFFFIVTIFVVILAISVLKKWILTFTPPYVLILFIVGIGMYLAKENLKVIGRFFNFACVLIVVLIFLEFCSYKYVNYKYLFPIGQTGAKNILLGAHDTLVSMLGFEFLLVLFPFVKGNPKSILKCSTLAISFVTLLYTFFLITSYMSFSSAEIEIVPEPILYLLKALSFQVVERLDLIFLSIWVVPILTSVVTYLYLSSFGISRILKLKNHNKTTIMIGILISAICFFVPQDETFLSNFGTYVSYTSYLFIFIIPLILLIISILRKRKEIGNPYEV
ncbi:GerAB/ArcD/ProY family transporter [Gottfriedia luciferensis]|uniref:GerAB/ArcD/ProY family transporter n=1 Tax=Gottfriedia luciferensis TaxID=178774 RepID=UPI000B43A197|nr:endospore germination permease [Gottfriedia luciferensis]